MIVPTGDGNFKCLPCGKVFSTSDIGKRHFKSAHQPYEPSQCEICHQTFKNEGTKKTHLKKKHGLSSRTKHTQ